MGRGSLSIGTIAGIRIGLHPSWFVIAFVITFMLAASLPESFPGWQPALYWIVAAIVAALFFASVLAHELSHAFVARRFGVEVRDITLFIFGGAASLEQEAPAPRAEAVVAAAGPLTSLLIGGVLLVLTEVIGQPQLQATIGWLANVNIALGIFNLIPGFPMDGGRILRALLWKLRGDQMAATRNAAAVGRGFGYLLIAVGVWLAFQFENLFSGIWLALIGWFLSSAAESAVVQMSVERSLRGVKVRDVMEAEPPSVLPNETVADLVNDRLMRGDHRSFLVQHADGGLAGIVTLTDVRRLNREDWPNARVTDVMTRYGDLETVGPDDPVESALGVLQRREVNQLPVVTDGGRTVVGLLTRAGVLRLIDTRLKLGV
jgi:Zn-dependent protease/CBS domain-containing protein